MRCSHLVSLLALTLLAAPARAEDEEGKDHPLFTRMKDYSIQSYEVADFDRDDFTDTDGKDVTIEGKRYEICYQLREGAKVPSDLQITRNYANAIRKIGGGVYEQTDSTLYMNLKRDGKEVWARLEANRETYTLVVVEKAALVQEVTASNMLDALNRDGRIALQILFDTGKATIKPESAAVVEEIASLLRENPALKVGIEGHTDAAGSAKANRTLSAQRAKAVADAVAAKGIDPKRMKPAGFGQDRPVADNSTDEGRARNRRVEIVKL